MKPSELNFKRRFSVNLYKNLRLKTAEMSMCKDWVNDKRGDPYPVTHMKGDVKERVFGGSYTVSGNGKVARLISGFMPIYTYEFKIKEADYCNMGFVLEGAGKKISVMLMGSENAVVEAEGEYYEFDCKAKRGDVCSVTFRSGGVSLYIKRNVIPELICDVSVKALDAFRSYDVFSEATVSLVTEVFGTKGKAKYSDVQAYLCGGISHADMKPMKYEDGTPIIENGRVYMTMSSRLEVGCYQSIISWNPTLCDFKLEGAILYDVGDGLCESDVAASIVYDRNAKQWYIWYCSFSHGHVLARGTIKGDPRFGVQIVDAKLLPLWSGNDRREFAGVQGDEDPDLCLIDGKWNLTVCRLDEENGKREYHYYRFVSDDPLDGFKFVDKTPTGGKTGGMMTRLDGKYYFVCGTDFNSRANYDVYDYDDFSKREKLVCDYDDGGFRGWGTVFSYPSGSRERVYWITFDRHNASGWNWSYGNIYVYEAKK